MAQPARMVAILMSKADSALVVTEDRSWTLDTEAQFLEKMSHVDCLLACLRQGNELGLGGAQGSGPLLPQSPQDSSTRSEKDLPSADAPQSASEKT